MQPRADGPALQIGLPKQEGPAPTSNWTSGGVLWQTAFRPFFLLAALQAMLVLPLWVAIFVGVLPAPQHFAPVTWHAHEMLFGYTVAVLAGFLLTAAARWTGLPTASGRSLIGLVLLWLLGRVLLLAPAGVPGALIAAVDIAFLPALTLVLARPILGAKSRRNYGLLVLLLAMAMGNLALHLQALGISLLPDTGLQVAVDGALLFMLVIGGRIVPLFTGNRLGSPSRRSPAMAKTSLGLTSALLLLDLLGAGAGWAHWLALAAGAATLLRMRGWRSFASRKVPMLWILHLGYLWLAVALLLRGFVPWVAGLNPTHATHAVTAGAIGALTLGMMARVSLGHTGRGITADPPTAVAFAAMLCAGMIRVFGALIAPAWVSWLYGFSATLWVLALAIFFFGRLRILTSRRPDGRPG